MNNGFPIPAYATGAGFEGFCARIQAWQREHLQHTIFSSSACESLLGLSDGHEESTFQIHRAQWDGLPYEVAYDQRLDPSSDDQSANNRFTASPWAHRYDTYHHARRTDLLDWVPASVRELMDWGGGEGGFLCELRNLHPHMNLWLAEISAACLEAGKQCGLNTVYSDDLSALDALRAQFDLVSLLDSLEHHSDPLALLRQIRCLLRPDAYLLLSVPHIGFWPVLYDLSEGRFEYEALGPLCETHLRFFSETGLRRLLAEANFEILRWEAVSEVMPMNPQKRSIERFSVLARRAG
jgi:SAM-dependent methyltransferase